MQEEDDLPPREFFDDEFAERLIGKTLLVGITHEDHNGRYLRRSQFYGRIIAADRRLGVCVRSDAGEEMWFPPDTRGIKPAQPGVYRNRATGEVVADPDYTATWVFNSPPPIQ